MHKRKMTLCTILIFLFISIPSIVYADGMMFYNMTRKNGLSQSTIKTIFQDSDGYIWIGTTNVLNKYNGYECEIYNKGFSNKHNIVNGHISCLNEYREKNLWVGTADGLTKISLKNNEISNYTINSSSLSSNKIRDIKITNNDDIIIATAKGLNIYDKSANDFILLADENIDNRFTNILSIEIYDNNIYGLSPNCLFKYDIKKKQYNPITNEKINSILESDTFTIMTLYKDNLYLGTEFNGIFVYNIKTNQIEKDYKLYKNTDSDISSTVQCIYVDEDNIWAGTNEGLYLYDNENNIKQYTKNTFNKYSLRSNDVKFIMKDSSNLLWLGTSYGLSTANFHKDIIYYNPLANNSDTSNIVNIYQDIDNKIWLGINGHGIEIFDSNNNTISYINTKTENKLSSDNVLDINGNEKYIFAATEKGVNIIDRNTLEVKVILDELNDPFCNTLYVDGSHLWIGTIGGFNIINLNDFSVKSLSKLIASYNIHVNLGGPIFKDSKDIYWLGTATEDGLLRLNPSDYSLKLFTYNEFKNSISDNTILSISEDDQGNLWFGTESGLNKYDRKTNEFKLYSTEDGLSNNTIHSIIPYKSNKLFITTNAGIDCLTFENDKIVNIKKYICAINKFNSNSAFKTNEGKILFGGRDGLYILNPNIIKSSTYIPKVRLDSFKVNGLEVEDLKNASISYKDNYISIKLSTTIYNNYPNIKFYYRIDRFDNKWTLIDGNELTLSNLASGKYNIDFKIKNFNGIESAIETLSFRVKPSFWETPYVKVIYITFIIIFMIYLSLKIKYMNDAIILRDSQLGKEMQEKNELLKKNIKLEKRKNNYLINMSHELRTPLNVLSSIQQLLVRLNENGPIPTEELSKYIKMSDNNIKRLLKIINDLIDSSRMDSGSYRLFFKEKNIIYVIEEAALSLKNLAEEKNINLIFDTSLEECIMTFDEDAIERCIVNIVGNALKFTECNGEILVNITDVYNLIRIDITDNGCGISPENINTIFDRFNQAVNSKRETSQGSGLGLTITKKLIELHNGEIFVTSQIGKGSTFTIILPKNH